MRNVKKEDGENMPRNPNPGEERNEYASFCIKYMIDHGEYPNTEKGREIAAGHCYSIYDEWKKKNRNKEESDMKKDRVLLHLNGTPMLRPLILEDDGKKRVEFDRSTILVGDGTYNGVYFPKEELEKAYKSWDRQPINLDHSEKVEDIVGYVLKPVYDKVNNKITVKPFINDYMPKARVAYGYINSRLEAGTIPEVSVGVWVDREHELDENGEITRIVARNLQGDHLALVTRGACSPQDGCGIGLQKNDTITIPHDNYVGIPIINEEIEVLKKEILKLKIKEAKENE